MIGNYLERNGCFECFLAQMALVTSFGVHFSYVTQKRMLIRRYFVTLWARPWL